MRTDRYKEIPKSRKNKKGSRTPLKVLLLLILLLLIAIPSAVYYSYKSTLDSLFVAFTEGKHEIEVGTDVPASEFITDHSGDLHYGSDDADHPSSDEAPCLDTDSAGEHSLDIKVQKPLFGGLLIPEKSYTLNYTVSDNTPPVVLWSGDGAVVVRGEPFDISSVTGYGDNADPSPKVEYKGKVDTDTIGDYPLHVKVTDASGNSVDWDMSVHVSEFVPTYTDNSPRTKFTDFTRSYAGKKRHFGIDVSEWQGDIDFKAVKKAGCEFAIIRIGYSHEGKVTMDENFRQNFECARKAGIKVGLYLYSYDNTEEKVRESAKWITEQLGGDTLDLPIAFDWEDFGQFQTYEMSFIGLNHLYDAFADELSAAGYDTMLYGSRNNLEKIWLNHKFYGI